MADQENPEINDEAAQAAAETPAEPEPEAAASDEEAAPEQDAPAEKAAPAPEAAPAPSAPAAPPQTREERRVAARARRGRRRPSTPEERAELRRQKAAARSRRRKSEREKRAGAPKGEGTPPAEPGPGAPKVRLGRVVSDKADKTITVRIDTARRHRRYQKIVRSSTMLHAHDETNDANAGDLVRVVECRPMSATKRWRLVEVLERAE
jgi:small subunit ribosomal protein S17